MLTNRDTIAAIATGAGQAGIGIVRVSGARVPAIADALVGQQLNLREAHYLPFRNDTGEPIDVGIIILFDAPNSYTGENVLELQGHGGPVVLDMLLSRVLQCGARLAKPGEFTERAFLNNKLDLAQAEAVADLIESSSVAAASAAVRSMSGGFSSDIASIQSELIALRAWIEAALDFSEDDIDFLAEPQLACRAQALINAFAALLQRAEQGRRFREGLTVVIAGVANVGKSSLLNVLSDTDTAIVTNVPGTTRDVLHEHISLDGVPIHIIDTAGLRDTDNVVEQEGITRARQAILSADHVLLMVDATDPIMPELQLPDTEALTVVFNKIDLLEQSRHPALNLDSVDAGHNLCLSVKTGLGLAQLRKHLLQLAGHDKTIENAFSARRRHVDALQRAQLATQAAMAHLQQNSFPELAAEHLREAQQSLDTITGRFDSEDLLGEIFSNFCIGK